MELYADICPWCSYTKLQTPVYDIFLFWRKGAGKRGLECAVTPNSRHRFTAPFCCGARVPESEVCRKARFGVWYQFPKQAFYTSQVGDANLDHQYWGRPEEMTMPRTCVTIGPGRPGSDVAGETAAALAAGAIVFKEKGGKTVFFGICIIVSLLQLFTDL